MCPHRILFVAAVAQNNNWCFDLEVPNEETFEGFDLKSLDIDQVRNFLHIIFRLARLVRNSISNSSDIVSPIL